MSPDKATIEKLREIRGDEELRRLDVASMISTEPEPVPWQVEGLVVRGTLTLLAGLAGQGKSLMAQALAIAATTPTGGSVAGMKVEASRVLIVDAENGKAEIHRRIHALGLDADNAQRLTLVEAEGFHLADDLHELDTLLDDCKPDLVILDGLRSLWPVGDENRSEDIAPVLDGLRNLVRRHDVGAILIHHTGKNGATYRGSSAIGAAVELVFVLGRAEGDDDRQRRQLRCEKCRPAPEPAPRWLRLATEQDLKDGVAPIDAADPYVPEGRDRAPVTSGLEDRFIKLVQERGELTRAEFARIVGRDVSDGTVRRAVDRATASGQVARRDDSNYTPCLP